jgi:rhodanese-related sulfurtransferase
MLAAQATTACQDRHMDDETPVAQAEVVDLPADFGPTQSGANTVLLDVREDDEWQRGHAAQALHIPMGQVPARLKELDAQAELYVICHAGGRSLRVAKYLRQNGYRPVNVNGGMLAWAGAGRPVVTDTGQPGLV